MTVAAPSDPADPADALADVVRVEGARILATLTRTLGNLQLAEDAVQEASVAALTAWPRTGLPESPRAWLTVAARRRAVDHLRREALRTGKETEGTALVQLTRPDPPPDSVIRDDQLRLVFTCCHPALAADAQVALTLRTLCGLSTAEVARALLVEEPTMAKRLVRTKQKIARARIPYRVPSDPELPERLAAVCTVVHLVYTSGHTAAGGPALLRVDLCDEAVRLGRLLVTLMPDEPAPAATLALLLLTDARRSARVDPRGDLVLLADQDRSRWDADMVAEGVALLRRSLLRTGGLADAGQLRAAIAACHSSAASNAETDRAEIVRLYGLLEEVDPSPVVRLNRAVAVAELDGPAAGLAVLTEVRGLDRLHLLHATRGELSLRLGRSREAVDAFDRALACSPSDPERRHLQRRRATALAAQTPL